MKLSKKLLSLLLCAMMVLGTTPLSGFVGIKFPSLPFSIHLPDFSDLFATNAKAESFTSDDNKYYLQNVDTTNKTAYISGITDSAIIGEDGCLKIPGAVAYSSEEYTIIGVYQNSYKNYSNIVSVEFPSSVKHIGDSAFNGCTSLSMVSLGQVETIGKSAFFGTAIETITLPSTLKITKSDYGNGVFGWKDYGPFSGTNLKSVTFAENTETIPAYCLSECRGLTTVNFAQTTIVIEQNAFYECISLPELKLPEKMKTIGENAFYGCTGLFSVIFDDNLTTICDSAFNGCTSLSMVSLGQVETIGKSAFFGTAIETITLPSTLKITKSDYGNGVFGWKDYGPFSGTNLKSVTFAENTVTIPAYCLSECRGLTTINFAHTIKTIGQNAFFECIGLVELKLPKNIETIGANAFYGCTGITSLELNEQLNTIGESAFNGCAEITSLKIPNSVIEINDFAFKSCEKLKTVDLGQVETIGKSAFFGTAIETIILPSTLKITKLDYSNGVFGWKDYGPFSGTNLKSVTFAENTETIPAYCLSECRGLTTVDIPSSVTSIGNNAFTDCIVLTGVDLPERVRSIGNNAFLNCTSAKVRINKEDSDIALTLIDYECPYEARYTGINDAADRCLNRDSSSYMSTSSGFSMANTVNLVINYKFKDSVVNNISLTSITIKLPSTIDLLSTTVNGVSTDASVNSSGILTLKPTAKEGLIKLSVLVTDSSYLGSYAKANYKLNGSNKSEVIGIVNIGSNLLTLSSVSKTSDSKVKLSGITNPNTLVDIFVDGEKTTTVISRATGAYSTIITLPNIVDGKDYTIEAKANEKSASTVITYKEDAVNITAANMIYRGKEYDLLNNQGTTPVISWASNTEFSFYVKVNNASEVANILIKSTKGRSVKFLIAKYDSNTDSFVAKGFKNYVPGSIDIICYSKDDLSKETVESISNKFVQGFIASNKDNNILTVENAEDDSVTVKIDNIEIVSFKTDLENNTIISIGTDSVKSDFIVSQAEEIGKNIRDIPDFADYTYDSENDIYYKETVNTKAHYIQKSTTKHKAQELTNSQSINMIKVDDSGNVIDGFKLWGDINDFLSKTFDKISYLIDNPRILSSIEQYLFEEFGIEVDLLDTLESSNNHFNFESAIEAIKILDFVRKIEQFLEDGDLRVFVEDTIIYKTIMNIVEYVTGLINEINNSDNGSNNPPHKPSQKISSKQNYRIDPSGFVFEAVPSNRLADVRTTIYYSENADGSNAVIWDASEYDQENPINTYEDGTYLWDVPEGYWQVKYELDGYETAYSEWMNVPPERTDVNIGLISNASPKIDYINAYSYGVEIGFSQYMDLSTITNNNIYVNNGTSYTIESVDKEDNGHGIFYAKTFRLITTDSLTGSVKVNIKAEVKNYCGKSIASACEKTAIVSDEIKSLSVSNITIVPGDSETVVITAAPDSAANGKTATISCINNFDNGERYIVRTANSVAFDAEGKAYLLLNTQLPGEAIINVKMDKCPIGTSFVVSVGNQQDNYNDNPIDDSIHKAKETGKAELESLIQNIKSDEALSVINNAINAIESATSIDAVNSIVSNAKADTTSAERALEDAKVSAKTDLLAAKEIAKSNEAKTALDIAITNIDKATSQNAVASLKAEGIIGAQNADEIYFGRIKFDKVSIITATEKTIDYRSIVTIKATATGVPEGYKLAIYLGSQKVAEGNNKSVSYEYGEIKSDINYTVKVIDANGKVQKDSNGKELSKDGGKITCNAGFFKKLIAFFKGLFKSLPKVEVKP